VEKSSHPETWRFGYFGSYARGDWGVGSDLDLVAFVADSPFRFDQRSLSWDLTALPVPAELVVYTLEEWQQLKGRGSRLVSQIEREAVWIYSRAAAD
jgi:predicted nucleotidyltransferase